MNQIFQRLSSVFLYTLPLKASIPFGYYLFYKYSFLKILLLLTFPIAIIEKSLPFGSFLLFIILFAGLVRNPNVPYFVRYNACQALLIDIALIRNLQNWILSRQKSSWCVNLGEKMCAFPLVLSSDNFDSICRGKSAKISDLVKDADGLYFPSSMFPQEKLLNINHPHQWEQFCSDYFFV
mgnify:CR=1 FL=1